jgi:sensor c-di-GMP phosphodiesterase-like protein
MSALVNALISARHQRMIGFLLWMGATCCLLAGAFVFARHLIGDTLRREVASDLAHIDKVHGDVASAFDALHNEVTAAPCGPEFLRQLRAVAFRPDGLNEFIYAPGGMVTCSTSMPKAQNPLPIGAADISKRGRQGISYWIDKRLNYIGLTGMSGIVAHREPFAIVIPMQAFRVTKTDAVEKELVVALPGRRVWHVDGGLGLYNEIAQATSPVENLLVARTVGCGIAHSYCVAAKMSVASVAMIWRKEIAISALLIAFYALWPAMALQRWLAHYWSLGARFRRNMNANSIVCAYQPILNLKTGQISGCEVLARWRDVDGSIVPPDRFIDIVSQTGKTLDFTKMVADRAFDELSRNLPATHSLQINFNIFPRDLDCAALKAVFAAFVNAPERFQLALEIVESDALSVEQAEREIEALSEAGIRTYIDDFGSGYSSIHRLASLAIHGVKLDRSFAMAPSESMMSRMLAPALDMVGSCEREIVVEGIETQERLDLLSQMPHATYAQGYFISRPLPIERFAAFMATRANTSATVQNEAVQVAA